MNEISRNTTFSGNPAKRDIAHFVRHLPDGTVVRFCGWDGVAPLHSHADYWLVPGFVVSDGDEVPREAVLRWTGGYHFYFRVGDECLMPTNGILPDGTFDRDILMPDDTIRKQGTITSKEYEEKYRPWNDGVPGTMTEEEEERYRRLGAMSPQRIRRTVGKA